MSSKAKGKRKMDHVDVRSQDEESPDRDSSENEADFAANIISAGVRMGPPLGNIAGSSKQRSKGQDHLQVAQQDGNQAVAHKKMSPLKKAFKIDTPAEEAQDKRSKSRKSAKEAKSTKRKAEQDLEPGRAKSSKSDRARTSGRTAEGAPVAEPLAVSNSTTTEGQRFTDLP
jgi:hypothetical protein